MEEREVLLDQFIDEEDLGKLMDGAEAAFHKGGGGQLMKPVQVCVCSALMWGRAECGA